MDGRDDGDMRRVRLQGDRQIRGTDTTRAQESPPIGFNERGIGIAPVSSRTLLRGCGNATTHRVPNGQVTERSELERDQRTIERWATHSSFASRLVEDDLIDDRFDWREIIREHLTVAGPLTDVAGRQRLVAHLAD